MPFFMGNIAKHSQSGLLPEQWHDVRSADKACGLALSGVDGKHGARRQKKSLGFSSAGLFARCVRVQNQAVEINFLRYTQRTSRQEQPDDEACSGRPDDPGLVGDI